MAKRLSKNLSSAYVEAMNRLRSKRERHNIIAYVESYDDVFFWSHVLSMLENDKIRFEVMLPSRQKLNKGKKEVLSNILGEQLGQYMIACVDADYDYLMQGVTHTSDRVCNDPNVFHTYVYAIENYRCYAPSLRGICVMATLNDRRIFDFETFLKLYSQTVWPLFVWSIWAYRHDRYKQFSLLDFYHIVRLSHVEYQHPERTLEWLQRNVHRKVAALQHEFPEGKSTYKPLMEELQKLGVTPDTTYLYMRGHDVFEGVVMPMLEGVCKILRREKEREIQTLAVHRLQYNNELSGYQNSTIPLEEILRRHTDFANCPQFLRLMNDLHSFVERITTQLSAPVAVAHSSTISASPTVAEKETNKTV